MSSYGYREVEEDDGDATEEPDEAGGERDEVTAGRRHLLLPGRLHPLTPPVPVLLLGRRAASDGPRRAPSPPPQRRPAGRRREREGGDGVETRRTRAGQGATDGGAMNWERHLIFSSLAYYCESAREEGVPRGHGNSAKRLLADFQPIQFQMEAGASCSFFFFIPLVLCGRLVAKNRDRLFHIIIGLSLLL